MIIVLVAAMVVIAWIMTPWTWPMAIIATALYLPFLAVMCALLYAVLDDKNYMIGRLTGGKSVNTNIILF